MSVLRYLRSKIPAAHHEARQRDKDEFFHFAKTAHHGFPSKPSALSHCPELNLLAVGTKTGSIRIYGTLGVEFCGETPGGLGVERLFFLPNQARLVAQCSDQSFHLWEANFRDGKAFLDHVKALQTEDRLKKISAAVLRSDAGEDGVVRHGLLLGTESGNVYALDAADLTLTDYIIYQDAVVMNLPDDCKEGGPGGVTALAVREGRLLLGFASGLVLLWDNGAATQTYLSQQGLQSLCWSADGSAFRSSHADGSYVVWSATDSSKPMQSPNIPYGPFPCLPITSLMYTTIQGSSSELLVFVGGMPKASYGDRHTVGLEQGQTQLVLEFTSAVVDVALLQDTHGAAHSLLVLCEEELVALDLLSDGWPQFRLPYLLPVHASPITAAQHVADLCPSVLETLTAAGAGGKDAFSSRDWPVSGGSPGIDSDSTPTDVLVTGHEDGSVKLWSLAGGGMRQLLSLQTAALFADYADPAARQEEEAWPPFRKVGAYDPFSDDPRNGVQRVCLDAATGLLVVGGTAGQVTLWTPSEEPKEFEGLEAKKVWIVEEGSSFVWKGEPALEPRTGAFTHAPGFVLQTLVQLSPPAAVTALAGQADWGLVGVGTGYGFALFDTKRGEAAFAKCLINPEDVAAVEQTTGRWKSMKKSIRQSFRQVNRRAQRRMEAQQEAAAKAAAEAPAEAGETSEAVSGANTEGIPAADAEAEAAAPASPAKSPVASPKKRVTLPSPKREVEDLRPVERAVVARADSPAGPGEQMTSLVRSLAFAQTFLLNATATSATFWVGTNGGAVQIHSVALPADEKRAEEPVAVALAKEIQLQHRAPVLGMFVVDGADFPLGANPLGKEETADGHRVLLCSEEQVKSFSLPSLKPGRSKYKMTALEGSRARKVATASLQSNADDSKWESFLMVMTNQGDVEAFSVHSARRYLKANAVQASDMFGINSAVLSGRGEGFFLSAPSEWTRFNAGAKGGLRPNCTVELPEGARPPPPELTEAAKEDHNTKTAEEEEAAVGGVADMSLDEANTTGNSTLPTDVTLDSIRDFTAPAAATAGQPMETVSETLTNGTTPEAEKTPLAEAAPVVEAAQKVVETVETVVEETPVAGVVTVTTKTTKTTLTATNGDAAPTNGNTNGHHEPTAATNGDAGDEIAQLKAANKAAENATSEEIQ